LRLDDVERLDLTAERVVNKGDFNARRRHGQKAWQ